MKNKNWYLIHRVEIERLYNYLSSMLERTSIKVREMHLKDKTIYKLRKK